MAARVKQDKCSDQETVMVKLLDRYRRDSTLFQFTAKRLRDFIDPAYLLIQIDERGDFAKLVQPTEVNYPPAS